MPRCLYCQQDSPPRAPDCPHCGMPLSVQADGAPARRQRRFLWFCIGLTLFCAAMMIWLPRSMLLT